MDYKESQEWYNWSTIYYFERQIDNLIGARESGGKYATARWDKVIERYKEALNALKIVDRLDNMNKESSING